MHNTLRGASEIVGGHIYWSLGPREINRGFLATYLADRGTVAEIGTANGLMWIAGYEWLQTD
jgi:hypothetical protein